MVLKLKLQLYNVVYIIIQGLAVRCCRTAMYRCGVTNMSFPTMHRFIQSAWLEVQLKFDSNSSWSSTRGQQLDYSCWVWRSDSRTKKCLLGISMTWPYTWRYFGLQSLEDFPRRSSTEQFRENEDKRTLEGFNLEHTSLYYKPSIDR